MMHYWDERRTMALVHAVIYYLFPAILCQNFLCVLLLGLDLNDLNELSWVFSGRSKHSAQAFGPSTFALFSAYSSVILFVTFFHLTPLSPATCLWTPSEAGFYGPIPTLESIFPFLLSPALILVTPDLLLLCQCAWLKCSPGRNKLCEENFLLSAFSSLCSDCSRLCWRWDSCPGGFWLQLLCFSLGVSGSRHGTSHCWII